MRSIARVLMVTALVFTNVSCENLLEVFADTTTDEAKYVDAQKLMNDSDFLGVIDKIDEMSVDFQDERKVVNLKATAYAGICGLRFMDFVQALGTLGPTNLLFPLLMSHFRSGATTTTIDACRTAEDLVESIGSIAARTEDENLLLLMISFAKMGNILSFYVDGDQNGVVATPYDACAVGGSRTAGGAISDVDAREFGTGLTLAMVNIAAVSSSLNLGGASLTAITSACTQLAAIPPAGTYDFCAVTDPTAFTVQQVQAIRSLIKEDQVVGLDPLGAGCNGDVSVCECIP